MPTTLHDAYRNARSAFTGRGEPDEDADERWVDLRLTVTSLQDPPHPKMAQFGSLGDETRRMTFVSWEASDPPELELGETYEFTNLYFDTYEKDMRLIIRSKTEATHVPSEERTAKEAFSGTFADEFPNPNEYADAQVTPVVKNPFGKTVTAISDNRTGYTHTARYLRKKDAAEGVIKTELAESNVIGYDTELVMEGFVRFNLDNYADAVEKAGKNSEDTWYSGLTRTMETYREYEHGTVVTSPDSFPCEKLKRCPDCGEKTKVIIRTPTCNNCDVKFGEDDDTERSADELEDVMLPEWVYMKAEVPCEPTIPQIEAGLQDLPATLRFTIEPAFEALSTHVERHEKVKKANDEGADVSVKGRVFTSDNYGIPSTRYSDLRVRIENEATETAYRNVFQAVAETGFDICKTLSGDEFERQLESAASSTIRFSFERLGEADGGFFMYMVSSAATSESSSYTSEELEEREDGNYRLVLPKEWHRLETDESVDVIRADATLNPEMERSAPENTD